MPERLECELLQKVRYINTLRPTFTFTFSYISVKSACPSSEVHNLNCMVKSVCLHVLLPLSALCQKR